MAFLAKKSVVSKEDVAETVFVALKPDLKVKVSAMSTGAKAPYFMQFDGGVYVPKNEMEYKLLMTRKVSVRDVAPVQMARLKAIVSSLVTTSIKVKTEKVKEASK